MLTHWDWSVGEGNLLVFWSIVRIAASRLLGEGKRAEKNKNGKEKAQVGEKVKLPVCKKILINI